MSTQVEQLVCTVPAGGSAGFHSPDYVDNGLLFLVISATSDGCVELDHVIAAPSEDVLDGGNTYIRLFGDPLHADGKRYPTEYKEHGGSTVLSWEGPPSPVSGIYINAAGGGGVVANTWGMSFGLVAPAEGTEIYIGYEYSLTDEFEVNHREHVEDIVVSPSLVSLPEHVRVIFDDTTEQYILIDAIQRAKEVIIARS